MKKEFSLENYELVFRDEFDGDRLDESVWNIRNESAPAQGGGLCFRTSDHENLSVSDGKLIITGLKDGNNYTSAKIMTDKSFVFKYGYIEISARLPSSKGIWPGFWMLKPNGIQNPVTPEIDIFEQMGVPNKIASNLHTWQRKEGKVKHWSLDGKGFDKAFTLPEGDFKDNFHTFGCEWSSDSISFILDRVPYFTYDISGEEHRIFHDELYVIISMAVGLPPIAPPDETTIWPAVYEIDWIRLYQKPGTGTFVRLGV